MEYIVKLKDLDANIEYLQEEKNLTPDVLVMPEKGVAVIHLDDQFANPKRIEVLTSEVWRMRKNFKIFRQKVISKRNP